MPLNIMAYRKKDNCMTNIIIPNPEKVALIKKQWHTDGCENFHVLADFDRTLTCAFVEGQQSPTVIAQIRNGNHLSPEYVTAAHALFDKYAPIEKDHTLSFEEKNAAMREWWEKHFKLLVDSGLTKQLMDSIVATRTLRLRAGTDIFLDWLKEKNIPLVIMSAAPGYMLEQYLRQENRLYDNIHVIANELLFDSVGNFIGINEPIIHSLNKYEIILEKFPIFKKIENRKNVLLLGDQIDDVGMITGFPFKTLLKIGFLNERPGEENPERLKQYTENYDIVLTGDPGVEYINELLKETF